MSSEDREAAFAQAREFVRRQREKGTPDADIASNLKTKGWSDKAIHELWTSMPRADGQASAHVPPVRHTGPTKECEICKQQCLASAGRKLTPRELTTEMQPKVQDMHVIGVWSFASSIVAFDNPPGAADEPTYWICSSCLSKCFSPGRSGDSLAMEDQLKGLFGR